MPRRCAVWTASIDAVAGVVERGQHVEGAVDHEEGRGDVVHLVEG